MVQHWPLSLMGLLEQLLILDIMCQNNHQPPDERTIAVIVEFENCRGPVFNENQPLCVPVCPITVMSQTEIGFHERRQLPLRLAWAKASHFQKHR